MFKTILISISFLLIASLELFSQSTCPPGYHSGEPAIIVYSPTCTLTVDCCISDIIPPGMTHKSIHITNFHWSSDDCILGWMQDVNGDFVPEYPSTETLIAAIVLANPDDYNPLTLNLCSNTEQLDNTYLIVSDGGCYKTVPRSFPEQGADVIPCDVYGMSQCHQYYTICYEMIGGEFVVHVLSGPPVPLFGCPQTPQICYPRCDN